MLHGSDQRYELVQLAQPVVQIARPVRPSPARPPLRPDAKVYEGVHFSHLGASMRRRTDAAKVIGRRARRQYLRDYVLTTRTLPPVGRTRRGKMHRAALEELDQDVYECQVLSILALLLAGVNVPWFGPYGPYGPYESFVPCVSPVSVEGP